MHISVSSVRCTSSPPWRDDVFPAERQTVDGGITASKTYSKDEHIYLLLLLIKEIWNVNGLHAIIKHGVNLISFSYRVMFDTVASRDD